MLSFAPTGDDWVLPCFHCPCDDSADESAGATHRLAIEVFMPDGTGMRPFFGHSVRSRDIYALARVSDRLDLQ